MGLCFPQHIQAKYKKKKELHKAEQIQGIKNG